MPRRKDISIGQDQWISWVEFDTSSDDLFNIDELLKPSWPLWKLLEIHCVAGCCGIDAFSFWPEDIQKASEQTTTQDMVSELSNLKTTILKNNQPIVISSKLNNLFDKSVFIHLLDHILKHLPLER